MMRIFNAFQMTLLFCAWPFIINFLSAATFAGAGALYWVAIIAFVAQFCFTVAAYCEVVDKV